MLLANKYKYQEHLSQLKQELSLKGKQKLSPQDKGKLKTAEVIGQSLFDAYECCFLHERVKFGEV